MGLTRLGGYKDYVLLSQSSLSPGRYGAVSRWQLSADYFPPFQHRSRCAIEGCHFTSLSRLNQDYDLWLKMVSSIVHSTYQPLELAGTSGGTRFLPPQG